MPVSHLTSSRAELLAALLNVLDEGANASALTMTESELLAAIRNTYGGSVSHLTTSQAGLLASIEIAAGGSGNALTESHAQILSGLLTARGGSGSYLTQSESELLAGIANIPAEGGGEEYEGPLDLVSGAVVAYSSTRALSSAKRGSALYTIKEDGGNTSQSFSTDAVTGLIDAAAITTFHGAANPFVTIWNDQSASPINLAPPVDNYTKWIAAGIGSKPSLQRDSGSLATSGDVSIPSGAVTIFAVLKNHDIVSVNASGPYFKFSSAPAFTYIDMYDGSNEVGSDFSDTLDASTNYVLDAAWAVGTKSLRRNGELLVSTSDYDSGVAIDPILGPLVITGLAEGAFSELLIYPSVLSDANRLAIRQNIATHYGITLS